MFDSGIIFDAALLPAMFVAMLAGIFSLLSPCVLTVETPYLAYIGGGSASEMGGAKNARRRGVTSAGFFFFGAFARFS